ncbi:hypothetical protein LEP1GSC061_0381 [Leptospira wolffii serovar Khorat str. Khorat-H2]|nr:hypothetical protein LEP1GSC061_0381 [Leptospira wolffii serovar Khorat str. Khorat-H2]
MVFVSMMIHGCTDRGRKDRNGSLRIFLPEFYEDDAKG